MKINTLESKDSFVGPGAVHFTSEWYEKIATHQRIFFKILEDDMFFENEINELRIKYKINNFPALKNFDASIYMEKLTNYWIEDLSRRYDNNGDINKNHTSITNDISKLASLYRMPVFGKFIFLSIVINNFSFIYPKSVDIEIMTPEQVTNSFKSSLTFENDSFFIKVKQNTSLKALLGAIKFNQSKINKLLTKNNCDFPKFRRIEQIDLYKNIFSLRKEGKTYSDIADSLPDSISLSDSDVRVMLLRYKRLIGRLRII